MASRFSPEERELLAKHVTDTDGDVFAVKNLAGIVGAAYARYSRAAGGFRETLLKEFIKEGHASPERAHDLIERVLIAYGDDSVGELEGAHVSFEDISVLATKDLEDRRIGGSPIEQSTRYVFYDQLDSGGNYRYYRDPRVLASAHADAYLSAMDFIFATYCELIEPMQEFYKRRKPIEAAEYDINGDGVKERLADLAAESDAKAFRRTYNRDIRTKACDTLRALLPIATKTNVGIFGNGRFFQNLLTHCYSQCLPEVQDIARAAHRALGEIIPRYVKRSQAQTYAEQTAARMRALARRLFEGIRLRDEEAVTLIDRGEDYITALCAHHPGDAGMLAAAMQKEDDDFVLTHMLYPHLRHPFRQICEAVRSLPAAVKQEIISTYIGERKTRRDRPGRALEAGYPYTFDLLTDFGVYKDLMRHRMNTQLRQKFTPVMGFDMPPDLEEAGFAGKAKECERRAIELYERILPDFPDAASYATLHGSRVRWLLGMNDREAMHMIELRTGPQGHPAYRKVCQKMHRLISKRSVWRGAAIKFADHNDYFWSRADSEARQRAKEKKLEEKP